ncbi:MAG: nucleoside triphosphate pyrophosphohydrolase [Gammaproteobacteria bacterium]|nr:nucleoside triphosphate pyrophosphohydrolase [Gammaproteobacteria bacterium]
MSRNSPAARGASHEPPLGPDGLFRSKSGVLDRALVLVRFLRRECEWDRRQTARSLVAHLVEEARETVGAIQDGDPDAIREELGDLLLNVAFQIVVAEEAGTFTAEGVVATLEEKMVRRHPGIFGARPSVSWEAVKAEERGGDGSVLDKLADGLDPLLRAHRLQERVSSVGFDWERPENALGKLDEEIREVEAALGEASARRLEEELGDLLFSVVNVARLAGSHAVSALARANAKFEARFRQLEALAEARGTPLPGASLKELDALWDEVKEAEREEGDPSGRQ